MAAANYLIRVERGVSFWRNLTLRNPTNELINLTGHTVELRFKPTRLSATVTLALSHLDEEIAVSEEMGTITISLSPSTTASLDLGATGYYELDVIAPDGRVTRVLRGGVLFDRPPLLTEG